MPPLVQQGDPVEVEAAGFQIAIDVATVLQIPRRGFLLFRRLAPSAMEAIARRGRRSNGDSPDQMDLPFPLGAGSQARGWS